MGKGKEQKVKAMFKRIGLDRGKKKKQPCLKEENRIDPCLKEENRIEPCLKEENIYGKIGKNISFDWIGEKQGAMFKEMDWTEDEKNVLGKKCK